MNKNKEKYLVLILVFCVIATFIGGYYLGSCISKEKIVEKNNKSDNVEDKIEEEEDDEKVLEEEQLSMELLQIQNIVNSYNNTTNLAFSNLLYKYYVIDNKHSDDSFELYNYVTSLSDFDKMYFISLTNNTVFYVENKLASLFGKNVDVKREDFKYYYGTHGEIIFNYDEETDSFIASDVGCFSPYPRSYYNYKFDSFKKDGDIYTITYYGLYDEFIDIGPGSLFNKDESIYYDNGWLLNQDEYLETEFLKDKSNFLKLEYSFEKTNDKFYLVDFREA